MAIQLSLSNLTIDFDQFVTAFETYLSNQPVWKGNLTTQTSQTLIELIASVGTFDQTTMNRYFEDSFSETAQSDDAIRSITQMQGLRMSRKLPAALTATVQSTQAVTINPMTQFSAGGQYYFNRDQINLDGLSTPVTVELFQGQVQTYQMNGLGSARQTFLSQEDGFLVSDQDVKVFINNTAQPKSFGTLWNYAKLPAFADLTTSDGRLMVVFGSEQFGTIPQITDLVTVQYALTNGVDGANQPLANKPVSVTGFAPISGTVLTNPTGGGNEQPIQTYKNLSSGAFGTYSSAVTKSQYLATVGVYPGIIDAVTQAQRDVNPLALEWMNVIRVSGLTATPWTQAEKKAFIDYLQTVTMYAPRFVWQDPIPVSRTLEITVYCFNTAILSNVKAACELALTNLFAPRPGLLLLNLYNSDFTNACKTAGNGAVSYSIVNTPADPMIVTAPPSPPLQYEIITGGGTLGPSVYAYGITTTNAAGEEGVPTDWVFPQVIGVAAMDAVKLTWTPVTDAVTYKVYGRSASAGIGLLATVPATGPFELLDNGSALTPGLPPNTIAQVPIRYNYLTNLVVNVEYAERQQRLNDTPTRQGT